jgi:hypothetical protein
MINLFYEIFSVCNPQKISKERCRLLPLALQNLEGLVLLLFEKKKFLPSSSKAILMMWPSLGSVLG